MDVRMGRRPFLKNAVLAGAALVVAPVALGAVELQVILADKTRLARRFKFAIRNINCPNLLYGNKTRAHPISRARPYKTSGSFYLACIIAAATAITPTTAPRVRPRRLLRKKIGQFGFHHSTPKTRRFCDLVIRLSIPS